MRRPLLVLPALALAILLSACSTAAPGWTYAPPTVPPASQPAASAEASSVPVPPSGAPAEPTPVPGGGDTGDAVAISALNVAFEQTEVAAPADKPFAIHFNNKDAGIPHNVEIKDAGGMSMFKGDIVTGPAEANYLTGALAAGTYKFVCTVHPNMTGTLKVGG